MKTEKKSDYQTHSKRRQTKDHKILASRPILILKGWCLIKRTIDGLYLVK